jgi:hypothetical protein
LGAVLSILIPFLSLSDSKETLASPKFLLSQAPWLGEGDKERIHHLCE